MDLAWSLGASERSSREEFGLAWRVASLLLGVAGPIACFAVANSLRLFGDLTFELDAVALAASVALALWIIRGGRRSRVDAFCAGALFAAAAVSIPFAVFAVPSAPLFVLGLFSFDPARIGFGLLGVVPLLCAFVYGRNALAAERSAYALGARDFLRLPVLMLGFASPFMCAGAAWLAMTFANDACLRAVLADDSESSQAWVARLREVPVALNESRWFDAWIQASLRDETRAKRVADAFENITDRSIDDAEAAAYGR